MGTEQKNSICDFCANCNCIFQTGIYREKCDFYIPVKELGYAVIGIEHLRKYRQLQNDYETRLKADMVAMLEDLDLQIDESAAYNLEVAKVQRLIRDKINTLKESNDVC